MNQMPPEGSATDLNEYLRDNRNGETTADCEPGTPDFVSHQLASGEVQTHAKRLAEQAVLPAVPTIADIAWLRGFAGIPILGRSLAFMREVAGALWLMGHRRSPIGQQIRFNRSVVDAFAYLHDLGDIHLRLDRELQALKSDVGDLESHSAAEERIQNERLDRLADQLVRLEAQIAALRDVVEKAPPNRQP